MSTKHRLLVIEDDPDILEILNIIFQEEGFEVISNGTGLSVQEILAFEPALIVLDVRIRGFEKTGAQLCGELKAHHQTSHLPILLMSAERDLPTLARQSGASAFVPKPFDIDLLLLKVNELIKR